MRLISNNGGVQNALNRVKEIQQIVTNFEIQTGRKATQSCIVEIGFGARPERAYALSAVFKTVTAIDLDAPLLSMTDIPKIFWRNGFERGLKSAIRHVFFDSYGWRAFHRTLREMLPNYRPELVNFVVGDASSPLAWNCVGEVNIIYSQDVFEHIPASDLRALMIQIHDRMSPDGMVMTRPMVFTGISGGHDLKWYPHMVASNSSEGAWSHLLDPSFEENTFLNKMTRREYCEVFREAGFEIVRDHATLGRFGEKHLTEEKRQVLSAFEDYELFSNQVEFWLVPVANERDWPAICDNADVSHGSRSD